MPFRLRLDSLAYRVLWHFKHLLRFTDRGPKPIVWSDEPYRVFLPPSGFPHSLDQPNANNFEALMRELEVLTRITQSLLPRELREQDWHKLVQLPDARARFEHLRFLREKEHRRWKDECKRLKHVESVEARRREWEAEAQEFSANNNERERPQKLLNYSHPDIVKLERRAASKRCIQAFEQIDELPRIAIDCRWLHRHSHRGLNLAVRQLLYLLADNRERAQPWPLFLTSFALREPLIVEARRRHLSILDSDKGFTSEISECSYLDLFPELRAEQKIVYLSPHSKEPLESVEPGHCYVIGGIVDRVKEPAIPSRASMLTAEEEGLPCRRLPLDYTLLMGGHPLFTLGQVLSILQHSFDSGGDWKSAFERHIPKRKFQPAAEKNQLQRRRAKYVVDRNSDILRILEEKAATAAAVASKVEEEPGAHGSSSGPPSGGGTGGLLTPTSASASSSLSSSPWSSRALAAIGLMSKRHFNTGHSPPSPRPWKPVLPRKPNVPTSADGTIRRLPRSASRLEMAEKRLEQFYTGASFEWTPLVLVVVLVDVLLLAELWREAKLKDMPLEEKKRNAKIMVAVAMVLNAAITLRMRRKKKKVIS